MDVLDPTLIWDWCRTHGVPLTGDDADPLVPIRLADDPAHGQRARVFYAEGQRSGREPAVADAALRALGSWDECLVWVVEWGVWASGEDWPRFYAWRGAVGGASVAGSGTGAPVSRWRVLSAGDAGDADFGERLGRYAAPGQRRRVNRPPRCLLA